jgi:hypothetical protein
MASVSIRHEDGTFSDIDYSLIDGRVRGFVFHGLDLYDESAGLAIDGWRSKLEELVRERGFDQDDGRGLRAFVRWLRK